MKRAISVLGSMAALAVLAPAGAGAATPALSIAPSPEAVLFGTPASVGGVLTPPQGVAAGGHTVKLYAKPFPYKRSKLIATATTAADGSYGFGVSPSYNTRYRAAVSDDALAVRSASKLLAVAPQATLKIKVSKSSDAISRVRLRYSSRLPLSLDGRKVTWYFHRAGTSRFVSRDHTRAREKRKGATTVLRARSKFGVPRGRYSFEVTYCIDVPKQRDIGLGPPVKGRGCPKSFRAGNPRQAAARLGAAAAPLAAGSSTASARTG